MRKIKLGILVSGSGSSAQALADNIRKGILLGYEIAIIICNKPEGKAGIYNRRENLPGIPIIHAKDPVEQLQLLKDYYVDLVVGLGYLPLVPPLLLNYFEDCFLNIHPGDTKKYGGVNLYGTHVHMAVLAAGEKKTYPTVHVMNEEYDKGRVLMQSEVDVPVHLIGQANEKNAELLQKHVLPYEYSLMVEVLCCIVEGRIRICFQFSDEFTEENTC